MIRMEKLALVLSLTLPLFGCGGSQAGSTTGGGLDEEPPPSAHAGPVAVSGSSEARATVGADGGTLSLQNGVRLEIPAGALDEPTEITLSHGAEGHAFGDRERQRALGPIFTIVPQLRSSGDPFVVSVPAQPVPAGYSEDDLAFAMEEVDEEQRAIDVLGTQTRWEFYPVVVANGRLEAHTMGLQGNRAQFGVAR